MTHRVLGKKCKCIKLLCANIFVNSLSSLVRKLPLAEGPSPTLVAENIE